MKIDPTATVIPFASMVRERGHSTPWVVDAYAYVDGGPAVRLFHVGPAQGAPGGIVCAPVVIP